MWKFLEDDHLFAHSYEEKSLDEQRKIAVQRMNKILDREFVSLADVIIALLQSQSKCLHFNLILSVIFLSFDHSVYSRSGDILFICNVVNGV